jgi:hypothetical protein
MKQGDAHRSGQDAPRPDIELHIEELVLEGFAPHERHRVAAAVEQHLARLLAERDTPALLARGGEVARLDGGSFNVARPSRPESAGEAVARAVSRGFDTK